MNLEKQALVVLGNWWKITVGKKKQKKIRSLRRCLFRHWIRKRLQQRSQKKIKITSESPERED